MIWINLRALEWALEFDADSKDQRIVALELAYHSDPVSGYTYPSVQGIAQKWRMDRETVRGQIEALLVKRAIFPTKKRKGDTGQINVYRLPKFLRQRGSQIAPLSDGKKTVKRRERGGEAVAKPPRTRNKEEGTNNNPEKRAEGNSEPSLGNGPLAPTLSSILSSVSLAPSTPSSEWEPPWREEARQLYPGTNVDKDVKRIEEWARKKRGEEPTRRLVLNALKKNPPRKIGARKRRAANPIPLPEVKEETGEAKELRMSLVRELREFREKELAGK